VTDHRSPTSSAVRTTASNTSRDQECQLTKSACARDLAHGGFRLVAVRDGAAVEDGAERAAREAVARHPRSVRADGRRDPLAKLGDRASRSGSARS
jgi:hypothetical protein